MTDSTPPREPPYDAIVVGAGFYGCNVALALWKHLPRVLVLEQEKTALTRASLHNQARVHNGYHYPRSLTTGLRSRANFPEFVRLYADCVYDQFTQYYAISRKFSNVSARQFETFSQRIGAPLRRASPAARRLFAADMIEEVFEVEECAFDADRLRERLLGEMEARGCLPRFGTAVETVAVSTKHPDCLEVMARRDGEVIVFTARTVYVCVYSAVNAIRGRSRLDPIPLRQEFTEICLIRVPDPLQGLGITVMCGPFFSTMPFPPRGLHSLSHVRYTPHCDWIEPGGGGPPATPPRTHFAAMRQDAARYLPALREADYVASLWETKTLLPLNDENDGRPILFHRDEQMSGLYCIIGGKIDNIFDVENEMKAREARA